MAKNKCKRKELATLKCLREKLHMLGQREEEEEGALTPNARQEKILKELGGKEKNTKK